MRWSGAGLALLPEALAKAKAGVYTSNSRVSGQQTLGPSAANFKGIFTAHFLQ
jgi:hypothetical protein